MHQATPLATSTTALVLVEFQREWTDEGRPLHDRIRIDLSRRQVVRRAAELRAGMAERGATIVHAPLLFDGDDYERLGKRGMMTDIIDKRLFSHDSVGAAFTPELAPRPGELIASGRKGISAFRGSDLATLLSERGIKTVVMAGFATNVCVEYTAAAAFDLGYAVIMARDAVATFDSPAAMTWLGFNVAGMVSAEVFKGALGEVLTNEEVLARLAAPASLTTACVR